MPPNLKFGVGRARRRVSESATMFCQRLHTLAPNGRPLAARQIIALPAARLTSWASTPLRRIRINGLQGGKSNRAAAGALGLLTALSSALFIACNQAAWLRSRVTLVAYVVRAFPSGPTSCQAAASSIGRISMGASSHQIHDGLHLYEGCTHDRLRSA